MSLNLLQGTVEVALRTTTFRFVQLAQECLVLVRTKTNPNKKNSEHHNIGSHSEGGSNINIGTRAGCENSLLEDVHNSARQDPVQSGLNLVLDPGL